jgi:hypothetical protein
VHPPAWRTNDNASNETKQVHPPAWRTSDNASNETKQVHPPAWRTSDNASKETKQVYPQVQPFLFQAQREKRSSNLPAPSVNLITYSIEGSSKPRLIQARGFSLRLHKQRQIQARGFSSRLRLNKGKFKQGGSSAMILLNEG